MHSNDHAPDLASRVLGKYMYIISSREKYYGRRCIADLDEL